ncbi:MAG: hypothetical protein J0L92_23805 [Deltaproteobacteria bacterium]|nr:hypothetical protein [Deltaproteobacteria bacterium]
MSRLARTGLFVGTALLATACDDRRVVLDDLPADYGDPTHVDLGTGPARARHRMDVDQLDASLFAATGMRWEVGTTNQLTRFRATLGVPNFATSTHEDLEPSPLFLKFVDDAARSVCTRLLDAETAATRTSSVFLVHADIDDRLPADQDAIDDNLAMLLARFHSRVIEPGSEELDPWRSLWSASLALTANEMGETDGETAWRTVCVALIDHPDFYLY